MPRNSISSPPGRWIGLVANRSARLLQELKEKGVDLFPHQQGLDTSTTAREFVVKFPQGGTTPESVKAPVVTLVRTSPDLSAQNTRQPAGSRRRLWFACPNPLRRKLGDGL